MVVVSRGILALVPGIKVFMCWRPVLNGYRAVMRAERVQPDTYARSSAPSIMGRRG
jgi:hypothetical protein